MPATLQAAIAARIDRLDADAKYTLNAAAVIGVRFDEHLLSAIADSAALPELLDAELIDQVAFVPRAEFGFRHPLIRRVAYESQLKADRAALHRRLADAIAASAGAENAALIAEHLQAAGDLRAAYDWHLRSAAWLTTRDIAGACLSWERAWQLADSLAADDADALALQIAPRASWCASAWRLHADVPGRFEELRELCDLAGDKASLAIGMTGMLVGGVTLGLIRETAQLAAEHTALIDSIADPALMVGLAVGTIAIRVVTGEIKEVLRWSETIIELSGDDPAAGNFVLGSPLAAAYAARSIARWCFALPGWNDDSERAVDLARDSDAWTRATVMFFTFGCAITNGVAVLEDAGCREIDDALMMAEAVGDDLAVSMSKYTKGLVLVHGDSAARARGLELLTEVHELTVAGRFYLSELPVVEIYAGREQAARGDADGAIGRMRSALTTLFERGQFAWGVATTSVYVETLLEHRGESGAAEAEAVIDRMAEAPAEMASSCLDLWLLRSRALLARAGGDRSRYRQLVSDYRDKADALGFEGHIGWAEAMT